ncbi:MAG: hypothetical protein JNM96_09245, partial [Bacteroidia bacterium]|nr:hypothetical protein [Bacteroidia bacterium]
MIDINGRLNLFSDALWAFGKKKNSNDTNWYAVGKINLVSADKKIKEVKLIPVNGLGTNLVAATMETELNAIYKKTGVEWKVSIDSNLVVSDYNMDSTLIVSRNNLNTSYGTDLKRIINAYKNKVSSISNEISYVFVCNKATNGELGYMALNKRYGFVFAQGNNNMSHTLAHELGHGNLVLEHTFEEGTGGQTQNLMDYAGGTYFNHGQWLNVHDPNTIYDLLTSIVQDEESGSYETDGHYSTVYLVCLMLGMEESKARALAIAAEDPDTDVHSPLDFELDQTWAYIGEQQEIHSLTGGFHSVEEFMTALKIIYVSKYNYKQLGELLHRYGDTYAHTRLDNLDPELLKKYENKNDTAKINHAIRIWKGQGAPPILNRLTPWIEFFNFNVYKYGYSFLSNETLQKQILGGKNIPQYLHGVYLNQPIDKFRMYGNDWYTGDHAHSDGVVPDYIYVRPFWYLCYVK